MGAPYKHAELSVRRFGGKPEDYLKIHELLDSSKKGMSDIRHRALTHNSWFVTEIIEKIFGPVIKNSEGQNIPVRDIAQWHIMEDFGGSFPSAQDFLFEIPLRDWMDNGKDGAVPPSHALLPKFDQSLLVPVRRKKQKQEKKKSLRKALVNLHANLQNAIEKVKKGEEIDFHQPLSSSEHYVPPCRAAGRID